MASLEEQLLRNSFTPIFMGAAGGGSSPSYHFTLTGDSGYNSGGALIEDSSGNLYQPISTDTANHIGPGFNKYTNAGVLLDTVALSPTVQNTYGSFVAVDGSDNVTFGGGFSVNSNHQQPLFTQVNSSGVIQWQKYYGTNYTGFRGAVVDSSNNIYFAGFSNSNGVPAAYTSYVVKINNSGVIQWQKYYGTSSDDRSAGIAIDSSDNIYIAGYDDGERGHVAKINSSGSLLWQRELGAVRLFDGIGVSPSGNVCTTGRIIDSSNNATGLVIVYNTSGSLQWARKITTGSNNLTMQRAAFDSAGNVYVSGTIYSSPYVGLFIKFNSSGTVQYQRTFANSGGNAYTPSITIDGNDDMLMGGGTAFAGAGSTDIITARFPNDGSGLGTYGGLTYANASYTVASTSTGDTAGNQSFGNITKSATNHTLALYTVNYGQSSVSVG